MHGHFFDLPCTLLINGSEPIKLKYLRNVAEWKSLEISTALIDVIFTVLWLPGKYNISNYFLNV